ncbi:GNAT family N-acetyltransferase [Cetobacterium somerae]|jgi:ribosomal-protein-alanine N-acetyltransferase|uniref:GNAT family N-acetyltransferase n=1 Tax=Cetobacterium somerae TaxID=188913 RepID=UPI003D766EA7
MIKEIKINDKKILEKLSVIEEKIFPESFYSYETLKNMSLDKNYKILIFDEDIKGYLILHDSYDIYEIMKIAVKQEYRNQKIGKKLLDYYIENFDKNLFLEVRENNQIARKFYENLGFLQVGKRKNYYNNGENAILMLLEKN